MFIDALIVFYLLAMVLLGFRRGLIEEFGRLLGLILASASAFSQYENLKIIFSKWISADSNILLIVSYILIFMTVLFGVRALTKLIHFMFLNKSTKWVNRLMGSLFGITKGLIFIMVISWVTELLPENKFISILQNESKIAQRLKSVRENIIKTFNLGDPVNSGSEHIQQLLERAEKENG